jgi:hypothetical protein
MKWKTAAPIFPQDGGKRTRRIFALVPHKCEDGFTRWLETIRVLEVYRYHCVGSPDFNDYSYSWDVIGYTANEESGKLGDDQ